MKLGVHDDAIAESLGGADLVWVYRPEGMTEQFDLAIAELGGKARVFGDYDQLVNDMSRRVLSGDQVVFMSNGGFGGARQKLTLELKGAAGA